METEVKASTLSREWVNDWDLLSPRFQAEAAVYLQIIGVFAAVFLLRRRARFASALWAGVRGGRDTTPPESPSRPASGEETRA